jgi:hypothetical protein
VTSRGDLGQIDWRVGNGNGLALANLNDVAGFGVGERLALLFLVRDARRRAGRVFGRRRAGRVFGRRRRAGGVFGRRRARTVLELAAKTAVIVRGGDGRGHGRGGGQEEGNAAKAHGWMNDLLRLLLV